MIVKIIKKNLFYVLFLSIIFVQNTNASNEIKILFKIENQIITNQDLIEESNYLISLNKQLSNLKKKELFEIAKESLIREKIKLIEIEKNFKVKDFENNDLIEKILLDFYTKLGLKNKKEFEEYLLQFNISISDVIEKIKIEVIWNQLIAEKFNKQINIDEDKLKKKILDQKLNIKNTVEYDLSEIVFQANNQNELNSILKEIEISIKTIGFNSTANKFSISSSSKFGGKIGKIKENQLSQIIKDELKDLSIGQITKPIKVSNGFLILSINQKNLIETELNEKDLLKEMINFERNNQFERFSQIYYNKIKINTQINE